MKRIAVIPVHFFSYLVFRKAEIFAGLLSLKTCVRLGRTMGRFAHFFAYRYREQVRYHLSVAFSSRMSQNEIHLLTRKHFEKLGGNLMARFRTSLMSDGEIDKLVSFEGLEEFRKVIEAGHGVVGAFSHTANWELLARMHPLFPKAPLGMIDHDLRNPFINRHIEKRRGQQGTQLFTPSNDLDGPCDFLRRNGVLGVFIDQYPDPDSPGVLAPFCNRLTFTSTRPALIALRTGAPILFMEIRPQGEAKWEITFHQPIYPPFNHADKDQWIRGVTAELNRQLSESITDHPEEWFWIHNRFNTGRRPFIPQNPRTEPALPPGVTKQDVSRHCFLVRSPNPLGDACMSIPAVRAIKSGRPDAHVTILCRANLEPLWRNQPEVDDVIAIPGKATPPEVGNLIRQRRPFYDTAILFPNSTSSALEVRAGGVTMLFGYRGHHRKRLLSCCIPEPPRDPPTHHLERYLHIVAHLGANIDEERDRLLQLPPAPSPMIPGQTEWNIALCPGAEFGDSKRWPLDRYAAAIEELRRRLPGHRVEVSIVGSPAERDLGATLASLMDEPRENLAGKTSIGELIEHLKSRHLVVSNDTGTMHLAAALGIPVVAIFGSTEPVLTRPIGEVHRVIREKVDCSPCFKRDCPIDFRCMTRIHVDRVVTEILVLMGKS